MSEDILMKKIKATTDDFTELIKSITQLVLASKELWVIIIPVVSFLVSLFNFEKIKNFLTEYKILSPEIIKYISDK